jgi:hypothetical protein
MAATTSVGNKPDIIEREPFFRNQESGITNQESGVSIVRKVTGF